MGRYISWWVSLGPGLGLYMSVGVYINIVSWWVSLARCMSVDACISIVYIVPTIGEVICKLLFSLVLSISCQQLGECG